MKHAGNSRLIKKETHGQEIGQCCRGQRPLGKRARRKRLGNACHELSEARFFESVTIKNDFHSSFFFARLGATKEIQRMGSICKMRQECEKNSDMEDWAIGSKVLKTLMLDPMNLAGPAVDLGRRLEFVHVSSARSSYHKELIMNMCLKHINSRQDSGKDALFEGELIRATEDMKREIKTAEGPVHTFSR